MSAILKVEVVCDVAMTSTPNVSTTELQTSYTTNVLKRVLLFVFSLSHGSDKGM